MTRLARAVAIHGLIVLSLTSQAHTEGLGTSFTFQGRLVKDGTPVTDTCSITLGLWDAVTLGSQKGNSPLGPLAIVVNEGLFTVDLNFGPDGINGDARWLEITVQCPGDTDSTTLVPRRLLNPAPHALAIPGHYSIQNPTSPNLIGGYSGNQVNGPAVGATIGGGGSSDLPNGVSEIFGTVAGGIGNTASQRYATVAGGLQNSATDHGSAVGGGQLNTASGSWSNVAGGSNNAAQGFVAHVGGGENNQATGNFSVVPGGQSAMASGEHSFAAGRRARALHNGTFVWGDHSDSDFESTGVDQFLIRANGGVGVNTTNPQADLDVNGTTRTLGLSLPTGAFEGAVLTSSEDGEGLWSAPGIPGLWVTDVPCATNTMPYQPDQSQMVVGGFSSSQASFWQSFTAGKTGCLAALQVRSGSTPTPPGLVTLEIYEGEGIGGTLLHTQPWGGWSGNQNFNGIGISPSVAIQAGSQFTFRLVFLAATTLSIHPGNPYSLGQSSLGSAMDLVFTTHVRSPEHYVGINENNPEVPLQIVGGTSASMVAGTGYLSIGISSGANLVIDTGQIVARNGSSPSGLALNRNSGNVGVGRDAFTNRLEVEGDASKTTAGAWLANSDASIKTEVRNIDGALSVIRKLRPVSFRYTNKFRTEHPSIRDHDYFNYIAQEFQEVFPDWVESDARGLLQIDSYPASIYSVAAIQELDDLLLGKDREILEMRQKHEELTQRVRVLEALTAECHGDTQKP